MSQGRVANCGHPYYRVQKFHVWTQLSGHLEGNVLTEMRLCTDCQNPMLAEKLLSSMGMYVTNRKVVSLLGRQRKKKKPPQRDAA